MISNLQNSSHYIPDKYPVELNGLGLPVAVFWTSFTPLLWAWLLGIIIAITSIPFLLGGNYIIGVLLLICAIAIVANQFRKEVWLALSDEGLVHLANKQLTTIYWKDIIYTYQKGQKNQVTLFFIPLIRITHREFKIVTKSLQTIDITSLLAYPDWSTPSFLE